MRFSIIVPVYNVEKYIYKCLKSIQNQSYKDFEVIIVNDGSPDNSQKIINDFVSNDKRFISTNKNNGGLSDARNFGLNFVKGEYILFLDSDDYIETLLLEKINNEIECCGKLDLIRYAIQFTDEYGKVICRPKSEFFSGLDMKDGIRAILKNDLIEPAWIYAYRSDFFLKNDFKYPKGRLHEDFGLTPYILIKAKKISSIDYIGLNYVQRMGSIMNTKSRDKDMRKAQDTIESFIDLKNKILRTSIDLESKSIMMNFITRVTLEKVATIENEEDFKVLIQKLKKEKVYDYLICDNLIRKIKKQLARYNLSLYMKLFF